MGTIICIFVVVKCKIRFDYEEDSVMMNLMKVVLFVLIIVFCFVGMCFLESIDVLESFFPLTNPEAVLFTLTHNVGGAQKVVYILLEPCVKKTIEDTLFILSIIGLSSMCLSLLGIRKEKTKHNIHCILRKAFVYSAVGMGIFNLIVWALVIYKFPIAPYVQYFKSVMADPIYNSLYEEDYVYPDSVQIVFGRKRNLIFVMMESMESNFQDREYGGNLDENLIPEITELSNANLSFMPGGVSVEGTGWTMAETVAKTCGIPLQEPIEHNKNGIRNYLKKVVCLTDILRNNGYAIKLLQGTSIRFASMDYFSVSHGVSKDDICDLRVFERKGIFRTDTSFFESVKDADLYEEVKAAVTDLGKQNEPWMLWFYTMDTHGPYGRIDSGCVEMPLATEKKDQYPFVVRCASKFINDFIEWAKMQDWYENTTIVVLGDHPSMIAPEVAGFPNEKIEHYWLNFFMNAEIDSVPSKERRFTSFDMYPTILEAIGAKIEGRALGLGRSLFSSEPTLIEKYGKDSLNVLIKKKGSKYKSFWD